MSGELTIANNNLVEIDNSAVHAIMPRNVSELKILSDGFFKSGFYPNAKSVEGAMVIIQTGMELGLTPAKSMNWINIISGKPTLSAQCMNGLMQSKGIKVTTVQNDDTVCIVQGERNGIIETGQFTIENAKTAGLLGKDNWKHYPRRMLYARAVSELANKLAPDIIMGLYTPEEVESFTTPTPPPQNAPKVGPDAARNITPESAPENPPVEPAPVDDTPIDEQLSCLAKGLFRPLNEALTEAGLPLFSESSSVVDELTALMNRKPGGVTAKKIEAARNNAAYVISGIVESLQTKAQAA